jgi:hypothetical protein
MTNCDEGCITLLIGGSVMESYSAGENRVLTEITRSFDRNYYSQLRRNRLAAPPFLA